LNGNENENDENFTIYIRTISYFLAGAAVATWCWILGLRSDR
jgi:hypothetical protein